MNKSKAFIIIGIVVAASLGVAGYIIASSPVSDTFTDTSKIASNTNLTVDTDNGQVKLAVADSWTCGDTLVDARDSKTYSTVLINTQCWMGENINIGTRVDGSGNQGTDCSTAADIDKYCYSDSDDSCVTYGGLYQWDQTMCGSSTAGVQGICPSGWHVPTDSEQDTLDQYLWDGVTGTCNPARSGTYECAPAGTSLKTGGASGFEGLLAGDRDTGGTFSNQGAHAFFWSSTESSPGAWYRQLSSGQTGVFRIALSQAYGFSVRCLKD